MTILVDVLDIARSFQYHLISLIICGVLCCEWLSYRKLGAFKGPPLAAITSLWMAKKMATKKSHLELHRVYLKYGELVRVGPNTLLTGDPELLQRMSAARSGYTKGKWYSGQKVEPDRNNLVSEINEIIHTKRRAQVAPGYSGREIDGLEALIDKHVVSFTNLIRTKYLSSSSVFKPLDLATRAGFFTMDVTTDMAYGRPWGCLVEDADVNEWFSSMEELMPIATTISSIPWIAWLINIPVIGKFILPSDKDENGAGRLMAVAKEVVSGRFDCEKPGQERDMLGSFIRHGITKSQAATEASLQIIAGAETTATAIRATMLFVMTNPQIYRALQEEIDSTEISSSIISDEKARTLPYLQAVIKEGVRMWPPTAGLLTKVVPPQGDTINKRFIPGGTEIGHFIWAAERSKNVFGEDSTMFRPERWLEEKGEVLEKMEKSIGLAWGYGKYSCLGKNISLLELNKIFFELLRNFDFVLVDPSQPWHSENYGVWLQKDMFVRVTERVKENR